MKTKTIIAILLLSIIFTGCRKHECNALSWTDYNTVEDVWCNFKYLKGESMTHKGDTLKVYGWLFDNSWENAPHGGILTNRKDIQFSHNSSLLFSNPYVLIETYPMPFDSIMPENPYDSFVYATGTVQYDPEGNDFLISTEQLITMKNYEN